MVQFQVFFLLPLNTSSTLFKLFLCPRVPVELLDEILLLQSVSVSYFLYIFIFYHTQQSTLHRGCRKKLAAGSLRRRALISFSLPFLLQSRGMARQGCWCDACTLLVAGIII